MREDERMDLPEFVLARSAEEHAAARAAVDAEPFPETFLWARRAMARGRSNNMLAQYGRNILTAHETHPQNAEYRAGADLYRRMLGTAALSYADHPDYDPAWKVT